MPFEIAYRARFIGAHKSAIPRDVCGQDGHEPARLSLRHGSPWFDELFCAEPRRKKDYHARHGQSGGKWGWRRDKNAD